MKRLFSSLSFRRKLTLAFLAIGVLPLLICVSLLLNIFQFSLADNARENADSQLSALEHSFSTLLTACDGILDDLSRQSIVTDALIQEKHLDTEVYSALYATATPFLKEADFSLYDTRGSALYTTGHIEQGAQLPTDWGLLWAAGESHETVYRAVSSYDGDDRGALELCRAIRQEGNLVGYAVARLTADHLSALFGGRYTADSSLLVLDPFWDEVYASPALTGSGTAAQLRQRLLSGKGLSGEGDVIYTVLQQQTSGFYLVLQQPRPMADWVSRLFYLTAAFSVCLCVCFSLTAALWASRRLFRPIRSINDAMAAVEEGDLDTQLPVNGTDELNQLAGRFNRMTRRLKENFEYTLLQQQELNDAQVRMMQAQLNPHFLYNTLDTLKWLGKIHQASEVSTISADLAYILRRSISGEPFVPLEQELFLLDRYVEIQQIRFPGKFTYTAQVPEELRGYLIPRLMLQPLVENAIIHGFEDGSRGTVTVSAHRSGESLVLTVEDDGCGMSLDSLNRFLSRKPAKNGQHLGLYNVDAILRLHYGSDCGLRLLPPSGERGTCIQATLPIREQKGGDTP